MSTEAEISFQRKRNRKLSRPRPVGENKKDPDRVRLCGLGYLVLDDNRFGRATIKDALHGIGIRNVTEMESAGEALYYVYHNPVDAIVADFEIPGMNGAEFVRQLRRSRDERAQRIPVIMVSDHADEGHVRAALDAGVNEYIPKPFSPSDLYSRLRRSVVSPKPILVSPDYIGPDRRIVDNGARNGIERRCFVSPEDLLGDSAGPETKRIETAKPKPSFSVLSETDLAGKDANDGLAGKLKERIGNKGGPD